MRYWLALRLVFSLPILPLLPSPAFAVGKGEASLSGGLGFSVAHQATTRPGASVEARLLRGISDSWSGRLSVQGAWISASGATKASLFSVQDVGFTWAADILNVVPFADLGVVVADLRGGSNAATQRLGVRAGLGADYFLNRRLALSFLGHVDYFALRLAGGHQNAPTLVTFALHLTAMF